MNVHQIVQQATSFGAAHVVVTGGEPMIVPEIVDLTSELRGAGLHITIETAGTVHQPVACDLMSISPKLRNSVPFEREQGRWAARHDKLRLQPDVLRKLITGYDHQLKFVVASKEDLEEILSILDTLSVDRGKVILMPEGTETDTLHDRGVWIAEICKRERFRYSPRLHVDLWGNRRAV